MGDFFQNIVEDTGEIWVSLIDLIIVYYLVYISLRLVRGTRTVPMAVGLLLLVLLYTFSRQLGFATTYMLLDQFMSVVVIFTLIIFQDDIRRALVRFGKFAWFSKAKETAIIEEVAKAAVMMTKKKIGALIVFEREARLDEFILEPGVRLDSNITKELLYTIFIPMMENPLHDGAAIIRNFQIREAGSFLPLSTNTHLEKNLGTRHRAGLGITEQTDAVAVVVSEERGTISVCHSGKIVTDLDATGLRKELLALFTSDKNGTEETEKELVKAGHAEAALESDADDAPVDTDTQENTAGDAEAETKAEREGAK
ncbi:MAG: diadenylate cyclase CdaA [Deltaproteobacteria bacterium]|nr:diadenylate cyclase CdaA [Deltaproteobacteria bacterium]MBN2671463.1 diadenylate cyclase CdaA [Deltaproteobacteria bacterium]